MMAYKSMEQERGCGWRKKGLYAVSSGATVGGTIHTDCDFVALRDRIPVRKGAPDPGRGFVYVDGEAIRSGKPGEEWGITPGQAEALKLMWKLWGLDRDRFDNGLCQGAHGTTAVRDKLNTLQWAKGSAKTWPDQALTLINEVNVLRDRLGDCPLVPAIVESRSLHWLGPIANLPADTLAALWRLVQEISWATPMPRAVLDAVATIMRAIGAGADVPLLERFYVESEEKP